MIPEYKKFAHICVAIKGKQCPQGLTAPASTSIRAPLLDFEKLLMANDSEGCSGPDLEGTLPGFFPNNELIRHFATSKSASGVADGSQISYFFDPTGEKKDSIKDEARDGTGNSRQRATNRRADGSRRSATQATRKSARLTSSKISKTPSKPKSDKKKQAKPEVKVKDQVKADEFGIIRKIIGKCWDREDYSREWCYFVVWKRGGTTFEPCAALRDGSNGGNPRLVRAFEADMRSERVGGPRTATEVFSGVS